MSGGAMTLRPLGCLYDITLSGSWCYVAGGPTCLAATDSILRDPDNSIHPADVGIKDIMVTDVATVDEHASLRQAALFLEKHRIGCLPVVTDGMLKGIITETDFVAVAINLLEQLEETEPDDEFAETA